MGLSTDQSMSRSEARRRLLHEGAIDSSELGSAQVPFVRDVAAGGHSLPPLPYAINALAPIISAQTVSVHYRKHHKGYIDNLNKLVVGTRFGGLSPLQEMLQQLF